VSGSELSAGFDCFGGRCEIHVADAPTRTAAEAVELARRSLLEWHLQFSRFLPGSELSRLNRDRRAVVPASPLMCALADAIRGAGELTDGLVDGTLLDQIEHAGYAQDLRHPLPLGRALALAPSRQAAIGAPVRAWAQIEVDRRAGTVSRPAGLGLDGGGLLKGMLADALAATLAEHESLAIDCAGDLAIGGAGSRPRTVEVASPFDGRALHSFEVHSGGVATSGIGRRSWLDEGGRPAHHLLDPSTGRPAFTGVVQATAVAPSALGAEVYAKAALLSGPRRAARWLPHGGVIVLEDGSHVVIEPPPSVSLGELARYVHPSGPSAAGRSSAPAPAFASR
jgi:thiamine biosynthesis lipoprotein